MKKLLVTTDFAPLAGGISQYYQHRVSSTDSGSVCVLMNQVPGFENVKKDYKIIYKKFFCQIIWPHWLPLIWHIVRAVKKEKITHLWAGQVLPVGTAVLFISKVKNLPYSVTCHGNDLLRAKKHSRKYKLARKILHSAKIVEANTDFTKNILVSDYGLPEDKIKVIRPENTLSKETIDQGRVERLQEKYDLKGKKVLLTVARIVESKGIDRVIKALEAVWQENPDLVYLVVGDGPYLDDLKNLSDDDRIIFTGHVEHRGLADYYALSDVFIMTPKTLPLSKGEVRRGYVGDTESFGIVYLEALEFGLPVIAGDTGGVREIKSPGITFIDSGSIADISEQILQNFQSK